MPWPHKACEPVHDTALPPPRSSSKEAVPPGDISTPLLNPFTSNCPGYLLPDAVSKRLVYLLTVSKGPSWLPIQNSTEYTTDIQCRE